MQASKAIRVIMGLALMECDEDELWDPILKLAGITQDEAESMQILAVRWKQKTRAKS